MNNTQVQTSSAALIALVAGFAAGHGWLGLSLSDWTTLVTAFAGAGAILWPVLQTRALKLKDQVGKMPATTVVTDKASADALPDNKDVIAATPKITAAVKAEQGGIK